MSFIRSSTMTDEDFFDLSEVAPKRNISKQQSLADDSSEEFEKRRLDTSKYRDLSKSGTLSVFEKSKSLLNNSQLDLSDK